MPKTVAVFNSLIFNMVRETQDHGTFNSVKTSKFLPCALQLCLWCFSLPVCRRFVSLLGHVRLIGLCGSFQWDRQPFYNATGTGYTYPYREIYNNFWINNFNPQEATDNGAWGQTFTEAVDVINDLYEQC